MTAPSLLDELEGVVAARAEWVESDSDTAWNELALLSVNFVSAHHAEIADMAKRLEAAERDVARWRKFCKQASNATFPSSLLEDAFEMGSGVLDLHFDAATQEGEG